MSSQLYFDLEHLRRGNFFNLKSEIRTEEGYPYEIEDWIGRGETQRYSAADSAAQVKNVQLNSL